MSGESASEITLDPQLGGSELAKHPQKAMENDGDQGLALGDAS